MRRRGRVLLVVALVGVVGMAFRVSWNALRDVARAIGADGTAALLYPFVVDGLMALALIATLVLTGRDRTVAKRVLAAYTLASLVLNYVHGLVPTLHRSAVDWGRLTDWGAANWLLVLLATSLPVGSIYFGSDLVAKVLHHRPAPAVDGAKSDEVTINRSRLDQAEAAPLPALATVPSTVTAAEEAAGPVGSAALRPVAAESVRPRRSTGRVPESARSPRPTRTPAQLLAEARSATADWPTERLNAEAIRKAVRTSAEKARTLRDTLRAERAQVPEESVAEAA